MTKKVPRTTGAAARRAPAPPSAEHRPFAKLAKAPRRAPAEAPPTEASAEEDERRRFVQMMRGVRPLSASRAAVEPREAPRARLASLAAEGVRFEVFDDGDLLEGRRLDVDPSEIRKLRQTRYAVDGTLDLHGLDAASARGKLEAFLRRRRLQGDRAVLIVHGKGAHSPRGSAVLRGEIAAWLSQGKAQRDVAAFSSVTDRTGGSGAVFVLLAR